MRKIALASAVVLLGANLFASEIKPLHPVNTYSIVAYDSATGQFGAAVQSHWFKVANVIWVEAGVGAIATQSLVDYAYGPLGLEMLKLGKTSEQALAGLIESDPQSRVRQVAMVDIHGNVATHTGTHCIAEAGHQVGKNYSVQANLMRSDEVWPEMAKAFEETEGDLAERMLAALDAAQEAGGDIRGMQSAALVVVTGEPSGKSWKDRLFDLRVDDSPEPLKELRRLVNISRAYDHMNRGDDFVVERKFDEAGAEYARAAELAPGNLEILFWHAATLVTAGEIERSLPIFKEVFAGDESWRELIPRLVTAELLPDDPEVIKKIMDL